MEKKTWILTTECQLVLNKDQSTYDGIFQDLIQKDHLKVYPSFFFILPSQKKTRHMLSLTEELSKPSSLTSFISQLLQTQLSAEKTAHEEAMKFLQDQQKVGTAT